MRSLATEGAANGRLRDRRHRRARSRALPGVHAPRPRDARGLRRATRRPRRLVVLEFPSVEQARAWYDSEVYREAKALRQRCSTGTLLLVEGAEIPAA